RDRETRQRQSRRSRQVAGMIRRDQRDAEMEGEVRAWFEQNITPDLTPEEAFRRIGTTLARTAWKLKVAHLTPTLRDLADAYRRAVPSDPAAPQWLRESGRWRNQDHARVAALHHLAGPYRPN